MGAVSALNDLQANEIAPALLHAFPDLTGPARKLALDALFRDETRIRALLDAIEAKQFERAFLGTEREKRLSELSDPGLRNRARELLP